MQGRAAPLDISRTPSYGPALFGSTQEGEQCVDRLSFHWSRRSSPHSALGLTTASAAPSAGRDPDRLDAYTAVVQAAEIPTIAEQGIDVSGQRPVANGIELDMVLDQAQADRLRGRGVDLKLTRVKGGKTVQAVRGGTGRQRLQRLALVRRARRHPRPALRRGAQQPPAGEARGPRPHRPGSRDHRGQADPGRSRHNRTARVRPSSTAPPSTRVNGSPPRSTGG